MVLQYEKKFYQLHQILDFQQDFESQLDNHWPKGENLLLEDWWEVGLTQTEDLIFYNTPIYYVNIDFSFK